MSEIEDIRSGKLDAHAHMDGTPVPIEPSNKPHVRPSMPPPLLVLISSQIPSHEIFDESDLSGVTVTPPSASQVNRFT